MQAPELAAQELKRCVKELGKKWEIWDLSDIILPKCELKVE